MPVHTVSGLSMTCLQMIHTNKIYMMELRTLSLCWQAWSSLPCSAIDSPVPKHKKALAPGIEKSVQRQI